MGSEARRLSIYDTDLLCSFRMGSNIHGEMKIGQNRSFGILHRVKMFSRRHKDLQGCLPRVIYSGNFQLQRYEEMLDRFGSSVL